MRLKNELVLTTIQFLTILQREFYILTFQVVNAPLRFKGLGNGNELDNPALRISITFILLTLEVEKQGVKKHGETL